MSNFPAVDASYDTLHADEIGCFMRNDIELFVQCLWTGAEQPSPRVANLRVADQMGIMTAGYISLTRRGSGQEHVDRGRAGVPDELWRAMKFVAVDIELDGIRIEEIVRACNRVVTLGQQPILYTNYNSWMNKVIPSNPTDIADSGILLWNAYWDGDPDIDFPRLPFGGWRADEVVIEQWSGGTNVCGAFVDRNTVVRHLFERLAGTPGEENGGEEDMVDEVARQALADLKPIVAAQGEEIEALQGIVADVKQVVAAQDEDIEALQGIVTDVKTLLKDTNEEVDTLLEKAHEHVGDDPSETVRAALTNHKANPAAHADVLSNHTSNPDAHHE